MFEDSKAIAFDFETYYDTKAGYSLTSMSPQNYCADPRFDPYLVAICGDHIFDHEYGTLPDFTIFRKLDDGRQLYIGRPENFPDWSVFHGRIMLAHNLAFDSVVAAECVKRGVIKGLDLSRVDGQCTADLTAYLGVQRNLKAAMKWLFGKEISKEVRALMDSRHVSDLSQDELRRLYEYGGSDAVECHDLWLRYASEWPEVERKISQQNRDAIARGVLVDRPYAESALKELGAYERKVVCDIPWTSEINPKTKEFYKVGSLPALKQAVTNLGIKPPSTFKKDAPEFLRWLEGVTVSPYDTASSAGLEIVDEFWHQDKNPVTGVVTKQHYANVKVSSIPFIRARQKAVSINMHSARVKGILESLDERGHSHPSFLYFGAHTGRFSGKSSTGGGNVNMLNMPRKPVLEGDENVFGGKGVDIRGMYIPRPGHKFVVFDYSQIEARFSLWLVNDTHMMAALEKEGNLYQANAVAMGWCKSGDKIKKTDPPKYMLAKKCVLGLGYGMGAAKFVDSCRSEGLILPSLPKAEWPKLDRRLTFMIRNVARIKGDPFSERNEKKVGQLLYSLRTVEAWRGANQLIVNKWHEYENVFKSRVAAGKETVAFRLPSGRVKRYWSPQLAKEETVEIDENGNEHPSYRIAMKACYVRGEAPHFMTGGSIMENIVQASCRDIMTYGCLEIEEKHPNWKFVFSVYDEVIFEVPDEECEEARVEVPRIMTKGNRIAEWTQGMPLEVEGDIVERYCK